MRIWGTWPSCWCWNVRRDFIVWSGLVGAVVLQLHGACRTISDPNGRGRKKTRVQAPPALHLTLQKSPASSAKLMTEAHQLLKAFSILGSKDTGLEMLTVDNLAPADYTDLLFSFYEEFVTTSSQAAMTSGSSMRTGWDEDQKPSFGALLQSPKGPRVHLLHGLTSHPLYPSPYLLFCSCSHLFLAQILVQPAPGLEFK